MLRYFIPLLALPALAAERGEESYRSRVLPVLEQYCFDCHSDGTRKGKFALDEHADYKTLRSDLKHWDHVRQMLTTHVMPPIGKKAPELKQRDALVQWIDDNVFWQPADQPDPGHTVLRRLNKEEYENTVRDALLLNDLKVAEEFPPDDSGYGYDNIGSVLSISPLRMEKYLRAARKIAEVAWKVGPPARTDVLLNAAKFQPRGEGVAFDKKREVLDFSSNSTARSGFDAHLPGKYRLMAMIAATEVEGQRAKIEITINGTTLGQHEVTGVWHDHGKTKWQRLEIIADLKPGWQEVRMSFLNDFYDAARPAGKQDLNVVLYQMDIAGPVGLCPPMPSRLQRSIAPGITFGASGVNYSGEDFKSGPGLNAEPDTGTITLASTGYVHHDLEISVPGEHRFDVKLGALQAGDERAKWEVRLGDRVLKGGEVTKSNQAPEWFHFTADLPIGSHELRVAFLNDFYDEKTRADRNVWLHEVRIEGPDLPGMHRLAASDVDAVVAELGERLYRRPLDAAERAKWVAFAKQAIAAGESPLSTLTLVTEALLASPGFLFHNSPKPAGDRQGKSELIDERSLAARLSYFLWSAPPDGELLQLAAKGQLRQRLPDQVRRLVKDWRAYSFQDNFAGQWLQLRDIDLVNPNRRVFKSFDPAVLYDMRQETEEFFKHILMGNRDVMEFLTADYTFMNRRLAKHYEMPVAQQPKGKEMVQVSLAGTPRGGLLTQGSILAVNSNPSRTNIVKRGKFILENLLGLPPPPVPADIPPLDDKKIFFSKQTLRQQFEAHRKDSGCAGCHALLDPIGFAMENYDPLGRWRDKDHNLPVDASGTWIRGQPFKDLAELRTILARDLRDDFVRCLLENLTTYALGRGIEFSDRPLIQAIVQQSATTKQQGFQDLIIALCESPMFQRMRAAP
jgi:hypothetical protein